MALNCCIVNMDRLFTMGRSIHARRSTRICIQTHHSHQKITLINDLASKKDYSEVFLLKQPPPATILELLPSHQRLRHQNQMKMVRLKLAAILVSQTKREGILVYRVLR